MLDAGLYQTGDYARLGTVVYMIHCNDVCMWFGASGSLYIALTGLYIMIWITFLSQNGGHVKCSYSVFEAELRNCSMCTRDSPVFD